jgi:hypothetical protein
MVWKLMEMAVIFAGKLPLQTVSVGNVVVEVIMNQTLST